MTIAELFRKKKISMRSYHVCRANKINNLLELNIYFTSNGSFLKFKNCGLKSNSELTKLVENLIIDSEQAKEYQLILFNNPLQGITKIQKEKVNIFIQNEISNLSVRSRNMLLKYCHDKLNIDSFLECFFENADFRVDKMKNIGSKSIPEIENYLTNVKSYVQTQIANNKSAQIELVL